MSEYLETDLAYIAGLVDGEGHISVLFANSGNYFLHVGITNTNLNVLKWIESILPTGIIYKKQKYAERKQGYELRWAKSLVSKEFLTLILPYLKIKREQAELAIEFCDIMLNKKQYRLDENSKENLAELKFGISLLNKRGE